MKLKLNLKSSLYFMPRLVIFNSVCAFSLLGRIDSEGARSSVPPGRALWLCNFVENAITV